MFQNIVQTMHLSRCIAHPYWCVDILIKYHLAGHPRQKHDDGESLKTFVCWHFLMTCKRCRIDFWKSLPESLLNLKSEPDLFWCQSFLPTVAICVVWTLWISRYREAAIKVTGSKTTNTPGVLEVEMKVSISERFLPPRVALKIRHWGVNIKSVFRSIVKTKPTSISSQQR